MDNPQVPMIGREHTDWNARLNAFKEVALGRASNQDELSWVLFDKNDPAHAQIPTRITSERELPAGAVVMTVDLSPTTPAEAELFRRQHAHFGEKPEVPPQSHAIYFTGHDAVITPLAKALERSYDRRTHEGDSYKNNSPSHMVRWDKQPADDTSEHYHLHVMGNNQPQSPVEGLRRFTLGSAVLPILERLSLEGPSSVPGYHEFGDKPLLAGKGSVMSVHLANELGQEVSDRLRTRAGVMEDGFTERFNWPAENRIAQRIARNERGDQELIRKENERKMCESGYQELIHKDDAQKIFERVAPEGRDPSEVLARVGITPNTNGVAPAGKR